MPREYDLIMTAPHSPGDTGTVLGGRYRLVAPVGVGVSSKVYLAVDAQLRRRVAVKVLHEALTEDQVFLRRFREEARRAAALNHPSILAVYDWGEDRDGEAMVPYLVTEYLAGGSLRSMLDRGNLLTPSQALMVGLEATRALAHAHERGLVHRDVKPGNLLFDDGGHVRLADFGLAKALAEASWTEPAGSSLGTVRYASPEQVLGQRLDGRSDVYSLALVLAEAVSGRVPLLADTAAGTMGLRTRQDVELPMEFGRLRSPLLRAASRDRDERSDAGELEIGLLAAATEMPRPHALALVPTLGPDERTGELYPSEAGAGLTILGVADPEDDAAGTPGDAAPEDLPGAGDVPAVGAGDEEPSWGGGNDSVFERTPIAVADEHAALVSSRPESFGRVEPLLPSDAGGVGQGGAGRGGAGRGARRARWVIPVLVLLLVGGGAGWWFLLRTPTHDVPDWIGQQFEEVRSEVSDNGWDLGDEELVRRDGTEAGEVVAQDPSPGISLAEGETVLLTVSLGPTLVGMPQVVGTAEADAIEQLSAAGLVVGTTTTAFDESVPAGSVVSATAAAGFEGPDAEGQIAKETPIDLVVSDGPAPRVVPEALVGAALADAQAALEAVQLVAEVQEQYDEAVPRGVVVSAGAEPGTEVARDSAVALVVSLGPAPIPVPDVSGQSGSAAAAALETAGFVVSGIEGSPTGVVLATDPPAGEAHQRGTAVRIFTRR